MLPWTLSLNASANNRNCFSPLSRRITNRKRPCSPPSREDAGLIDTSQYIKTTCKTFAAKFMPNNGCQTTDAKQWMPTTDAKQRMPNNGCQQRMPNNGCQTTLAKQRMPRKGCQITDVKRRMPNNGRPGVALYDDACSAAAAAGLAVAGCGSRRSSDS